MHRFIIFIGFILAPFLTKAHQPDVSTTMLTELENGKWVLQVNTSLTAFQQVVRTNYPDVDYKTPEEFQELVLKHLRKNILFVFNEQDTLRLTNGFVKLGHETNVVFETSGMPDTLKSLSAKNSSFKDISRNQSALVILKTDFIRKHFVLNNANQHSISLTVDGNKLIEKIPASESKSASLPLFPIFAGIILVTAGFTFWKVAKDKRSM